MIEQIRVLILATGLAGTLCAGCGPIADTSPKLPNGFGKVTGTITLDGKPLNEAQVTFDPLTDRMSTGATDADGNYTLNYGRGVIGAAPGRHRVQIGQRGIRPDQPLYEPIAPRFNDHTILEAVVKPGPNRHDFELFSVQEVSEESPDGTPNSAPVTGTVTLNGKPVMGMSVEFLPKGYRMSAGGTDRRGRYELRFTNCDQARVGAAVGHHSVRISLKSDTLREELPDRYNRKTELKAEVKPGKNEIDFELFTSE